MPDRVTLRLDRRFIPEEDGGKVERNLIALVKKTIAGRQGIKLEIKRVLLAAPLTPLSGTERLVVPLKRHARDVLGVAIRETGVPLYTDARHYAARGIPTVLYGAGPRSILEANAHGADEHLRLKDLQAAIAIVTATLRDLLKP